MGKIAYYVEKNKKDVLYLNITDNYQCTNKCNHCNKKQIEKNLEVDLYLKKKPTLKEITDAINQELETNQPNEIVFCGIGEPTFYLDTLLDTSKYIRIKHPIPVKHKRPIRLNTNGQAYLLHPKREIIKDLEESNIKKVSISLDSTNKEKYNKLHKPNDQEKAFYSILQFIKDCNKSKLETYVSFLETEDLNKNDVIEFTKLLGLKEDQIKFRPYLS